MFISFFPNPKLFCSSFALWALLTILVWFFFGENLQALLSVAPLFGDAVALQIQAVNAENIQNLVDNPNVVWVNENRIWLYQYVLAAAVIFTCTWMARVALFENHSKTQLQWYCWSVSGTALILIVIFGTVQTSAWLNDWYGEFYNLIQQALSESNQALSDDQKVQVSDFMTLIWTFFIVVMINITILVLLSFFQNHFVFRWRTAMTDHYMAHWTKISHVEGVAQRIQDDTFRFTRTVEGLGDAFIRSVMTLLVFLPLLYELSANIPSLPLIGEVDGSLVFLALTSAAFGTALVAVAGFKLPGLNFDIQREEAALRKVLVVGEEDDSRSPPPAFKEFYKRVSLVTYRYYFHLLYFGYVRIFYQQASVFIPVVAMLPAIVSGTITFGLFTQISRAFDQVEESFKFLVNSWVTIVELLSIYKRLRQLDFAIEGHGTGIFDTYGAKGTSTEQTKNDPNT